MSMYIVSYDLKKGGKNDYIGLIGALRDVSGSEGYLHILQSVFLVKSYLTAGQILSHLRPFLDANDECLVAPLSSGAVWKGFDRQTLSWLQTNIA